MMMMPNRTLKSTLAVALFALAVAPIALHATPASARVNVGINFGVPAVIAPPVVMAPPPVVYAAPPPVVVAPPVVYAPAPVVVGGYWGYHRHGRRYWRR
jgi:hypothetical protein